MHYKKFKEIHSSDVAVEHNIGADWIMDYYHFHNVYEVYLSMTEGAEFWVKDQQYILGPNDLLLLGTNDLHRSIIHNRNNFERYIFYFNPLYASTMNTSRTNLLECFSHRETGYSHLLHLDSSHAGSLVKMFNNLSRLSTDTKSFASDVKTKILVAEILIFINEIFQEKKTFFDSTLIEYSSYHIIKPIMDYLDSHYQEDITTDSISEHFKINRHQLNTLFRDMTGLTFHQYLVSMRIIKARELLEAGNISITQTCFESGFNDYAHFIRTFKAMVGKSPGNYAKAYTK